MGRGARIKLEEIGRLGAGAQEQIRAALASRNLPRPAESSPAQDAPEIGAKHRMRQNRGPMMNKTEAAFLEHLQATFAASHIEREGVTLLLANGVRYTADFSDFSADGRLTLWEVKGHKAWDDAIVKLKVAAARFPRVTFFLASPRKDAPGLWRIERVMGLANKS